MADFKVQRGTATIPTGATTVTATAGTDYTAPASITKSYIIIRASNYSGCLDTAASGDASTVYAWINNPANLLTSITFSRGNTDATRQIHIDYEIVEYIGSAGGANEFVVRGQEAVTYVATSNTVSGSVFSPANDAKMAVFITGCGTTVAGARPRECLSTAAWNSGTHAADFTRNRNGNNAGTVSYVAVEFTGSNWSVQRVAHTYTAAGSAETASITDVGSLTRAFVHSQIRPDGSLNYEMSQQIWLSATNLVSFQLDSQVTSPGTHNGVAWVISNSQTGTGAANCNRYTGSDSTAGTTNITVTGVADTTQSSVEEISQTNTQNTGSDGRDQASYKLTTSTNVALYAAGLLGTTTYRFAVFEWPTAQAGGAASNQLAWIKA